jgi:hypothetical protein
MEKAVLLALAASLCTATASVCQRAGARCTGLATGGFDARLIVRLARQPTWLLGIAAMIGGFVFQLTALHFGELGLVQPILAAELLFVFGYLAVAGSRRPNLRDWLAVAGMSAGIGVFLRLAAPQAAGYRGPALGPALFAQRGERRDLPDELRPQLPGQVMPHAGEPHEAGARDSPGDRQAAAGRDQRVFQPVND